MQPSYSSCLEELAQASSVAFLWFPHLKLGSIMPTLSRGIFRDLSRRNTVTMALTTVRSGQDVTSGVPTEAQCLDGRGTLAYTAAKNFRVR